jgi:hypothetical protein
LVDAIEFLHPAFSIPAVLLIVTAYLFKKGVKKERFLAHYIAGTAAVALTIPAALIGSSVVKFEGLDKFPFTISFHLLLAFVVLGVVLIHGAMRVAMVFFGRKSTRLKIHSRLAKWVLVIYLIQGAFGLTILGALLVQTL